MQGNWHNSPFLVFDTETTGTDPLTSRIVQAAVGLVDPSAERFGVQPLIDALIDPGVEIPEDASKVHGITNEFLKCKCAAPSEYVVPKILDCIRKYTNGGAMPLVIYNVPYDWPLLISEYERITLKRIPREVWPLFLDPLVFDRALDKFRKGSRQLSDVANYYGVQAGNAHDAMADVTMTAGVMMKIVEHYPKLAEISLFDLQDRQRKRHAEWRNHINGYWERTGNPNRANGDWPEGSWV